MASQAAAAARERRATKAFTDYIGIGVHCAQGGGSAPQRTNGRAGHASGRTGRLQRLSTGSSAQSTSNPAINAGQRRMTRPERQHDPATRTTTSASPASTGWRRTCSLAWVAQMQEAGIPITSATSRMRTTATASSGNIHFAYGPGRGGLRRAAEGVRRRFREVLRPPRRRRHRQEQHALHVHGRRGRPLRRRRSRRPRAATASHVACNYNRVGEINGELSANDQDAIRGHHARSPSTPTMRRTSTSRAIRAQTDPVTRKLEREMAQLNWLNPYTNQTEHDIMVGARRPDRG